MPQLQAVDQYSHPAFGRRFCSFIAAGQKPKRDGNKTGKSSMNKPETLLLVADSDHDSNMLYAVGMFVPDPFIFFRKGHRNYIAMSDLEIDRARQRAKHCTVLSLSSYQKKLRRAGTKMPGVNEVLPFILKQKRIRSVTVPFNFPHGLGVQLQNAGIRVKTRQGHFFPEREFKSREELKKIKAALSIAETGMAAGIAALRKTAIGKNRKLLFQDSALTSEKLRSIIDTAVLGAGGLANHTIVAGGNQGCDPHEAGSGPLRADEPIIIDIFPRAQLTGYFGDITRTVVRGKASDRIKHLYQTVFQGQRLAFEKMRVGISTAEVHKTVQKFFESQGYKTGKQKGRMQGFFHGTGHGLGLEIHEAPRIGPNSEGKLKLGHIVTVEPGLYYPGVGGVRLEDVAFLTEQGPRNLTSCEKVLEI
jgi:Xaa-Pro aminopeptidase